MDQCVSGFKPLTSELAFTPCTSFVKGVGTGGMNIQLRTACSTQGD